jgi:hypothetical protein
MKADVKRKWLKELRSGEWVQGKLLLMNDKDEACCLGVLCDIAMREGIIPCWSQKRYCQHFYVADGRIGDLPSKVRKWAGLKDGNPTIVHPLHGNNYSLARMNDNNVSFKKIADIIEEQL